MTSYNSIIHNRILGSKVLGDTRPSPPSLVNQFNLPSAFDDISPMNSRDDGVQQSQKPNRRKDSEAPFKSQRKCDVLASRSMSGTPNDHVSVPSMRASQRMTGNGVVEVAKGSEVIEIETMDGKRAERAERGADVIDDVSERGFDISNEINIVTTNKGESAKGSVAASEINFDSNEKGDLDTGIAHTTNQTLTGPNSIPAQRTVPGHSNLDESTNLNATQQ